MSFLLDTNICVYAISRKDQNVIDNIENNLDNIYLSSITLSELVYGVKKSRRRDFNILNLTKFILPFEILSYDKKAADAYGEIRVDLESKGTPIGSLDSLIAAHALSNDMTLVTNNVREFERVQDLRIENWSA